MKKKCIYCFNDYLSPALSITFYPLFVHLHLMGFSDGRVYEGQTVSSCRSFYVQSGDIAELGGPPEARKRLSVPIIRVAMNGPRVPNSNAESSS
jgi:hypothetical protein